MTSLIRIAIVLAVSAAVGAGYATVKGLPWKPDLKAVEGKQGRVDAVNAQHEKLRATVGLTLEELRTHIAQGGVIIDARPREEFEKAHLQVDSQPPVLNVEPHDLQRHLPRLQPLMGQPLVIYCTSETCTLGEELYILLEPNQFFSTIRIYFPGWEGLQKAGLPAVAGPDDWATDQPAAETESSAPAAEEGETP